MWEIRVTILGRGYRAEYSSIEDCWAWYSRNFRQEVATEIHIERMD